LLENPSWYGNTIVYVSYNNLYITYPNEIKESEILINAIIENLKDILPQEIVDKAIMLKDLDLYEISKLVKLDIMFENYLWSIKKQNQEAVIKNLQNRLTNYFKSKIRDYDKSFLVKIDLTDLNVKAIGEIPGIVLNQFSLDEYQGKLRVAVTIGERNSRQLLF